MDLYNTENIIRLIPGIVVLFAGRNIFWLFIALIGFLAGIQFASLWLADQQTWMILMAGVFAGIIGALLAVVFERVAFALAGFYAAALLASLSAARFGVMDIHLVMIVAGIAGALIAFVLTDWAIIILSALAGAATIVSVFALEPPIESSLFIVLAIIGVLVQSAMLKRHKTG